jgi:hypothetical protein
LLHLGAALLYINSSRTNGVVSSEPLAQSERGRAVLDGAARVSDTDQKRCPSAAEEKVPVKVLKRKYYLNKAGGLACVWVRLLYSDGSNKNGVV